MDSERVTRTLSDEFPGDGDKIKSRLPGIFSYTKIFESLCPTYMAMGMSYDEFWYGDPTRVIAYRKADKIRYERDNLNMWIQGMYFYSALLNVSPLLNIFDKNRKPSEYMSQPIEIFSTPKDVENERNKKIQQRGIENMMAWASAINAKKGGEKKDVSRNSKP